MKNGFSEDWLANANLTGVLVSTFLRLSATVACSTYVDFVLICITCTRSKETGIFKSTATYALLNTVEIIWNHFFPSDGIVDPKDTY